MNKDGNSGLNFIDFSSELSIALWTAVTVIVCASVSLPLILKLLQSRNLMDVPNERSLHNEIVPRGAGLALAFAFSVGLFVSGTLSWPIWMATIGYAALGALDDLKRQSAGLRLLLQIVIAVLSVIGLSSQLGLSGLAMLVGALLLVSTVNSVNFMDGINGITALHSLVWGIVYGCTFWIIKQPDHLEIAVILASIGLAFLPWNMPKARIFLGDSGSYLIGGTVGVLALLVAFSGEPLAALCPLAIYATDTGSALIRRIRSGEKITEAHKSHVFQKLVSRGPTHSGAALIVTGFTALTASLGLLSIGRSTPLQVTVVVLVIFVSALYLRLPKLTKMWK
jgi:UDP-GlcNAc:undecaprenyl-phosphate/decaprenyl-phosphate GlcNAc-1-phosphate transferase